VENDFRRNHPRFAAENGERNAAIVEIVRSVAAKHGATPAQVALAWVFTRGKDLVPIPGTTKAARVEENAGALQLRLDEDDLRRLEGIADRVAGDRYNPAGMAIIQR
jgi:aryl-alcohol dehydrogenase-like predicted oxidoreductase